MFCKFTFTVALHTYYHLPLRMLTPMHYACRLLQCTAPSTMNPQNLFISLPLQTDALAPSQPSTGKPSATGTIQKQKVPNSSSNSSKYVFERVLSNTLFGRVIAAYDSETGAKVAV